MVLGAQSVDLNYFHIGTITYIATNTVVSVLTNLFANVQTNKINTIYCALTLLYFVRIIMAISSCKCPVCSGYAVRVRRRYTDRIINLFVAVHRYKCQDHHCQWQGNIRC